MTHFTIELTECLKLPLTMLYFYKEFFKSFKRKIRKEEAKNYLSLPFNKQTLRSPCVYLFNLFV